MATVDSKLASDFRASPHYRKGRDHPLTRVTIHHAVMVGNARMVAAAFRGTRNASATYAIGTDGSIVQCVSEADTPWTSNSHDNDSRAITIEVANTSTKDPWPVGAETMEALIRLLVDICQRNPGIGRLRYTGDTTGNLTMHRWFFSTQCPGTYLAERFGEIAAEVNRRLQNASSGTGGETTPPATEKPTGGTTGATATPYLVRVKISNLNIRKGPGTNYGSTGFIKPGVYTIVAESTGTGATKWGKLKSGAGWISLDYAAKT